MAAKVITNGAPIAVVDENNANGDNLSLSDDDEEVEDSVPQKVGSLNKWTNYIHGWQTRYFILRDGTLAYYKSENDTAFGCRGAVTISRAVIQPHDFDECRFDVCVNDSVWYLRADDPEERQKWIEALETYKAESGYGSQTDLRRHGSVVSLTSNKSFASSSSFKKGRGLKEKLSELETFRDIVSKQIETLQTYFDACADNIPTSVHDRTLDADELDADVDLNDLPSSPLATTKDDDKKTQNSFYSPIANDFKGESLTFKATTAGILTTLQHCIDLVQSREDAWKKRLEKEIDKRRKAESHEKQAVSAVQKTQRQSQGPDCEEGPHSVLNEEEWHDAVDAALERQDIEDRRVSRLLSRDTPSTVVKQVGDRILLSKSNPLYDEIDRTTIEQVKYAKAGVEEGFWQLFAEDGEMKMFKREVEIDGLVCDPLKAVHSVKGVSAREYLHYFFEAEYKMDWDTSLEEMRVVDRMSDDSAIIHQVHKRVWPASQRESLFWSHFRRVPSMADANASDLLVVCNHDTQHKDVPVNSKNVRVGLTVAMVCQTIVDPPKPGIAITRDDLTCKIIYVAQINPGGWAPSSVLRAVYKREYPKFLKRFTQYVLQKVEGTPVRF